jgi:hypothetical protein
MFQVFRLDSEGNPTLLETCIDKDRLYASIDLWSETYPHAIIDYVYKETN